MGKYLFFFEINVTRISLRSILVEFSPLSNTRFGVSLLYGRKTPRIERVNLRETSPFTGSHLALARPFQQRTDRNFLHNRARHHFDDDVQKLTRK